MGRTNRHVNLIPTIAGECFGVRLTCEPDGHVLAQLLVEDDGNWFVHGDPFDVHWINDIISVLEIAKKTPPPKL